MEIMKLQVENHKNKFEAMDETMNLEIEQKFTEEATRKRKSGLKSARRKN